MKILKIVRDQLNYESALKNIRGLLNKKLDAINNGVMLSLKFYIFYSLYFLVVMHDISSLK